MSDSPRVTTLPAQMTAVVRLTVPLAQMRDVVGPAIGEVVAAAKAQGIGPTGPWFLQLFRMDPDVIDFEVGVPVSVAPSPTGRVVASELPAGRVATMTYEGPYEGLMDAWGKLKAWVEAEGLPAAPNLWDRYVTGPESGLPAEKWRTELVQPLLG